jgi:hypothetical protein
MLQKWNQLQLMTDIATYWFWNRIPLYSCTRYRIWVIFSVYLAGTFFSAITVLYRFEVFTVVKLKIVFCVVVPRSVMVTYQHSGCQTEVLQPQRWRQHSLLKCWYSTIILHGTTTQETTNSTVLYKYVYIKVPTNVNKQQLHFNLFFHNIKPPRNPTYMRTLECTILPRKWQVLPENSTTRKCLVRTASFLIECICL